MSGHRTYADYYYLTVFFVALALSAIVHFRLHHYIFTSDWSILLRVTINDLVLIHDFVLVFLYLSLTPFLVIDLIFDLQYEL